MENREIVARNEIFKDWPDDDEVLMELCADRQKVFPENYWSLRDAFEGVQVFGGTGSGKSSGSGQALARAFLSSNLGGLVLTAKTDEAEVWKNLANRTGRTDDILEVESSGDLQFNFLSYELNRPGRGAGHTETLVNLFCTVAESAEKRQGGSGGGDAYWNRAFRQLLRNAIDLAVMALDDVDLDSLYRIIASTPTSREEVQDERWRSRSVCFALIETAREKLSESEKLRELDLVSAYFLEEMAALAPETRSVIVSVFTSMADCFMRGVLRKLFCEQTNFRPEDCFDGKIIIFNLPVKEFNELGQFAQVLFKFVWQRAVERRIPPGISREEAQATIRPVFLFADESQFFVNGTSDALFQSTARSSRACTVYLTQNLPTYYAAFGGVNGRHEAESFLGNLQTKIAHANGDPVTCKWLADSIGQTKQIQISGGTTDGVQKGGRYSMNQNAGVSLAYEYSIPPVEFTTLETGGPDHDFQVGAIIFQGGRSWLTDGGEQRNYIRHRFPQSYVDERSAASP